MEFKIHPRQEPCLNGRLALRTLHSLHTVLTRTVARYACASEAHSGTALYLREQDG
jgi:hypothetical protein